MNIIINIFPPITELQVGRNLKFLGNKPAALTGAVTGAKKVDKANIQVKSSVCFVCVMQIEFSLGEKQNYYELCYPFSSPVYFPLTSALFDTAV